MTKHFAYQLAHALRKPLVPVKLEHAVSRLNVDGLAFADFAFQDVDAERVENFFLDGAAQRTSAVNGIVTFARQELLRRLGKIERVWLGLESSG